MRDPKTTLIGLFLLMTILFALLLVWFGKASLTEAGAYAGTITGLLSGIGFMVAKDGKREAE